MQANYIWKTPLQLQNTPCSSAGVLLLQDWRFVEDWEQALSDCSGLSKSTKSKDDRAGFSFKTPLTTFNNPLIQFSTLWVVVAVEANLKDKCDITHHFPELARLLNSSAREQLKHCWNMHQCSRGKCSAQHENVQCSIIFSPQQQMLSTEKIQHFIKMFSAAENVQHSQIMFKTANKFSAAKKCSEQ